jgi:hypothetical protein
MSSPSCCVFVYVMYMCNLCHVQICLYFPLNTTNLCSYVLFIILFFFLSLQSHLLSFIYLLFCIFHIRIDQFFLLKQEKQERQFKVCLSVEFATIYKWTSLQSFKIKWLLCVVIKVVCKSIPENSLIFIRCKHQIKKKKVMYYVSMVALLNTQNVLYIEITKMAIFCLYSMHNLIYDLFFTM